MSQYLLLNQTSSNYECRTTELITDEEILSAFGESIRFDEGKIDSFIDCLEDRADWVFVLLRNLRKNCYNTLKN